MAQITETIQQLDAIQEYSNDYFINISERNNNLVSVVFPQINTWATQANGLRDEVNTLRNNTLSFSNLANQNRALSETAKDEANLAKTGAENAYQNTIELLEQTDITGTAGYTIEAIDNMHDDMELQEFLNFNI
jgi:hypothetical protein